MPKSYEDFGVISFWLNELIDQFKVHYLLKFAKNFLAKDKSYSFFIILTTRPATTSKFSAL